MSFLNGEEQFFSLAGGWFHFRCLAPGKFKEIELNRKEKGNGEQGMGSTQDWPDITDRSNF